MKKYHYEARNKQGDKVVGDIDAISSAEAAKSLINKGLTPTKIRPIKESFDFSRLLNFEITPKKVKSEDLVIYCRQMYSMVKAGVPLLDTLDKLADTTRNPLLKRVILDLKNEIGRGQSFSDSARRFPNVFPVTFVSVVEAGERSGQLDEAFLQLASHFELEVKTTRQVKSATRYPMLVISALVGAFVLINYMVIPAFADMFARFKTELPIVTRGMMATSRFMVNNGIYLGGGVVVFVFVLKYLLKTPKGRYVWDKGKLKMPLFGPILQRIIIARFSRIFVMIVKAGVPLSQGISLIGSTVGNAYVQDIIQNMQKAVNDGETLSQAADKAGIFSGIALQMLSVGEDSGTLDLMLEEVADYYEREVAYDLDQLGDLIEPILLVIMGAMVLVIALGIFLPMWNMTSFVKK